MLSKQDKQWLSQFLGKALEQQSTRFDQKLDALRVELVQAMAEGFSECASAGQMDRVEKRLSSVEDRLAKVEEGLTRVQARTGSLEQKFSWVERNMVTKEYLDDRLGERSKKELILHKGHTNKISSFVQKLYIKGILSGKEANGILALEPFSHKIKEHE